MNRNLELSGPPAWACLPDLDCQPPPPWIGVVLPVEDQDPYALEDHPPVEEPWAGPIEPVREPGEPAPRWRLH